MIASDIFNAFGEKLFDFIDSGAFDRENIISVMVKSMNNPRSALIKTSIMTASDIFNAFGEKLFDFTDSGAFDRLYISGTKMVFPGLKKPQDRADLIAYLKESTA